MGQTFRQHQPSAHLGWDEHKEITPSWVASDTHRHRHRHNVILSCGADILLKCSAQCDGCPPSHQTSCAAWLLWANLDTERVGSSASWKMSCSPRLASVRCMATHDAKY